MNIEISFKYSEKFLPPRCRKYRTRNTTGSVILDIQAVSADDAPIACIVKNGFDLSADLESLLPGAAHPYDIYDVRYFGGHFYRQQKRKDFYSGAQGFATIEDLSSHLENQMASFHCGRNYQQQVEIAQEYASEYILIGGFLWYKCGEPKYAINTFGLGHNHGGTSIFVHHHYNGNLPASRYFNANNKQQALEAAKAIALRRGDTKSIDTLGDYVDINVLMPHVFRADPATEAGEGDPFLNRLESICEETGSSCEAGLLAMAMTLKK